MCASMTRELLLPKTSLVPLHLAVRIVYAALNRGQEHVAPTHERFEGLGQAIIALVPIYCAPLGDPEAKRVQQNALRDAIVRQSGREIRYADGRPPLRDLFISRTSIEHVIEFLRAPESEPPVAPEQTVPLPPGAA
jgi:hypothetical protein